MTHYYFITNNKHPEFIQTVLTYSQKNKLQTTVVNASSVKGAEMAKKLFMAYNVAPVLPTLIKIDKFTGIYAVNGSASIARFVRNEK